ncbi:redoxin domain-containing protein [Allorhodopirellula solitaria]|uniref:Thiol-disulfide oxidoreductase ResA n=1 Tax=Allorhodopirellula solitaria TaxID=2527987 RepID=A0A5C5XQA2_9BACT|nr:redoxin domain-containing protein [Allorhodopirellula solitaria]TWT65074.1 Thiol-disulfide oxidoreductase ResA [Allorhodopirellula solitaria]
MPLASPSQRIGWVEGRPAKVTDTGLRHGPGNPVREQRCSAGHATHAIFLASEPTSPTSGTPAGAKAGAPAVPPWASRNEQSDVSIRHSIRAVTGRFAEHDYLSKLLMMKHLERPRRPFDRHPRAASVVRFVLLVAISVAWFSASRIVAADEQPGDKAAAESKPEAGENDAFQPSDEVQAALLPLFEAIADTDASRSEIELSVETVMHGEILSREKSTFQIASKFPDQYTIYHKSDSDRKRIYSDGETSIVALSSAAYYELPRVWNNQSIVTGSPIDFGPYPEPMLALTLAGVDPSITFFGGMSSVEAKGKTKFRGRTDSVHVRGQQDDGVVWDLWITDEERPRPLRLLVNLTPMLQASGQVHVPQGYGLSLRYDFVSWRVTGAVDEKLFRFAATKDSVKYDSMADYQKQTAGDTAKHPLLGKPVPASTLTLLEGKKIELADLRGKIVVLDFWATWCVPCIEAMPVLKSAVDQHADANVVLYAVNIGENPNLVSGFVGEQDWGVEVAVDPEGAMIDEFSAEELPLTLVISPEGIVESVHTGFSDDKASLQSFHDEIDELVQAKRAANPQSQKQ